MTRPSRSATRRAPEAISSSCPRSITRRTAAINSNALVWNNLSVFQLAPHDVEIPFHGGSRQRGRRRPEDGPEHVRREEHLQGLQVQEAIVAADEAVDGTEMVILVGVQLGHRNAAADVPRSSGRGARVMTSTLIPNSSR